MGAGEPSSTRGIEVVYLMRQVDEEAVAASGIALRGDAVSTIPCPCRDRLYNMEARLRRLQRWYRSAGAIRPVETRMVEEVDGRSGI